MKKTKVYKGTLKKFKAVKLEIWWSDVISMCEFTFWIDNQKVSIKAPGFSVLKTHWKPMYAINNYKGQLIEVFIDGSKLLIKQPGQSIALKVDNGHDLIVKTTPTTFLGYILKFLECY